MKKIIHGLILAVFGFACWITWVTLKLAPVAALGHPERGLPGFTTLCIGLRPLVAVLPVLAAAYCVWVWFRKADRVPSWIGFFAATTGALVLVTLPAMVAAYLPLLDALNHLPAK